MSVRAGMARLKRPEWHSTFVLHPGEARCGRPGRGERTSQNFLLDTRFIANYEPLLQLLCRSDEVDHLAQNLRK